MSHWTSLKVRLRNPNPELLKRALEVLARELGARGVAENYVVRGWGGRRVRATYAIPMRLPYGNGYGVVITRDGGVRVVVDDHGAPLSADEFAAKLTQTYTVLALTEIARAEGFEIVNFQELPEGVLIDLAR